MLDKGFVFHARTVLDAASLASLKSRPGQHKIPSQTQKRQIKAYIVTTDSGEPTRWTKDEVRDWVKNANKIYEQVGVQFELLDELAAPNDIQVFPNNDGFTLENDADAGALFSTHYNAPATDPANAKPTDAIEVYFVDRFAYPPSLPNPAGLSSSEGLGSGTFKEDGIAIANNSDANHFRVLAHELGHACGLLDIYTDRPSTSIGSGLVRMSWAPDDWNDGPDPAYYESQLEQQTLVKRLLMYGGGGVITAIDIPSGSVYGVDYFDSLVQVNVGVKPPSGAATAFTRNPKHR
jgi:hypothetical protein